MRYRLLAALAVAFPLVAVGSGARATTADSSAWLFNPLQVNAIDLTASPEALASLRADPRTYVDAELTLHNGSATDGPYPVSLKLKGHASFRDLDGKAAFKLKFGNSIPAEVVGDLKGLALNNMVQDPSMIAEATSSVMLRAVGVPTPRVGFASVRLNGDAYGLYAAVEPVDKAMAQRWFPSTQHIYEANYAADVIPGDTGDFDATTGPAKDTSDLDALIQAASSDAPGWSARMKPLSDLGELALVFAAEHYIGQWDGYSYGSEQTQPNNYDLHSDDTGRFSIIVDGTDQTWLDGPNFGLTGNGVLFRECLADAGCQPLYMAALRQIAANRQVAGLAATARAIRAAIAPWRARDPRAEQSVADGEAQADAKIAFIAARPAQLARWLGGASSSSSSLTPASSPRPRLGKPAAVPAQPVHGKPFALTVPVTRSDNGARLATATVACSAWIGAAPASHVDWSFERGAVRVSLAIPAAAKRATLRIRVEVTAARQTGGGIYSYTVG